jgi:hypothetical protein
MSVKEYRADFSADDAQSLMGKLVGITEWVSDESADKITRMGTVTMVMRSALVITTADADTAILFSYSVGIDWCRRYHHSCTQRSSGACGYQGSREYLQWRSRHCYQRMMIHLRLNRPLTSRCHRIP